MLEKAWRWTGRHLFSSYIFETVLESLYKKYTLWLIKDTWCITAFSYLCASSANFFESEVHSNFPTQMLTLSMELESTDTKAVLKLPFRCLYRGVQVEMHCYQHMLKPHWTHLRLSIFFQCSLGLFDLKGPGSSHNRSHMFIWRFTSVGELWMDAKDAEKLQILKGWDHFSQHWLYNRTLTPGRQLYSYITMLCCCEHSVNQYRMGFWITLSVSLFFFIARRRNVSEHQKQTKIA